MPGQLPNGKQQFIDGNGSPLAGGTVTHYLPGTTTPATTWQDSAGTIPNLNPLPLDAYGMAVIWGSGNYRQIVKNAAGVTIWDQVTADNSQSSAITYTPPGAGAVSRTVSSKLGEWLSVTDFGAKGNGVTDDTAAINAALAKGGLIWIPAGTYKTTGPLVVSVSGTHVSGAGEGATIIAPSSATSDVWSITNVAGLEFCSVRNMTIAPSVTQAAGAAFHQSGLANVIEFSGIRILNGYRGFYIETTTGIVTRISDFYIQSCTSSGIELGSSAGLVQDVFISKGNISTCLVGVLFTNVSGAYLSQIDIVLSTTAGIAIQPPAGLEAFALFFDEVLADTTTAGAGWAVGGVGKCVNIVCTNCWAAGNSSNGITLATAALNGFTWSAGQVRNNANHGILISGGCVAVSITGGTQIFNNGLASPGTYNGISVSAGQTYFQIVGVLAGQGGLDQASGATNAQNFGIAILSGASNTYVVSNNVCVGNRTAGVMDSGTGTSKFVGNNIP